MIYATCVQLALDNLPQISRAAADLIQPRNLKYYSHLSSSELAAQLVSTVRQHLNYLETGNIETWRTFCVERMTLRAQQNGADFSEVIEANSLVLQAIEDFLKAQLGSLPVVDGQPTARVLQSLHNRFNGLQSVAITTGTAVGLKLKNQ